MAATVVETLLPQAHITVKMITAVASNLPPIPNEVIFMDLSRRKF
jgi:hypothetical protein